jgi:predicted signal transduction protein with EAL and GGDEF domain
VQVSGLTGITAIAAGSYTGYALREDGTVRAWGGGGNGELGNGTLTNQHPGGSLRADRRHRRRRADIAMYKAKKGRDGHRVYTGSDDSQGDGRLRTLQELRTALAQVQMTLHYQPKLDLTTGEVHGVEALVRWDHPTRGRLYPDSFLALVEDAGLMRLLTQLVLEQALDQATVWQEQGRPLTVSVNLSASSLIDIDLPEQVGALLAARQLPAGALFSWRSPKSS